MLHECLKDIYMKVAYVVDHKRIQQSKEAYKLFVMVYKPYFLTMAQSKFD